jgi:hypothetical protein
MPEVQSPSSLSRAERQILRDLALRVAEIAAHPQHAIQRELWKRHNRLDSARPMVLVFPEGSWQELLPDSSLVISDSFFRGYEWHLRHLIYRWEHLRDDNVIEPVIKVGLAQSNSGWGMGLDTIPSPTPRGAWAFNPPIKEPEDADKLSAPEILIDEKKTQENLDALADVIGDILEVKLHRRAHVDTSLIGTLARLRGLDQLMVDMCDRPEWLHRVMRFMTEGTMRLLDQVERMGALDLNNGADYVGSGGVAYTDELPAPGFDGKNVRLRDLWGFAEAQELALVSPQMHEEFALRYQIRLLERFGLNCYGCCESLTHKFEIVKKVPRLRRISVSPFTDLTAAADALQDKYIFSWKPNPAELTLNFDPARIRAGLHEAVRIARGCVVEIVMKDTHTVNNEPHRLEAWVSIAKEVAQEAEK